MLRRDLLHKCLSVSGAVFAAPMLNFGRCRLTAGTLDRSYSVQAIDLVESSLVIDMLGLLTLDWSKLQGWHRDPSSFSTSDFQTLRTSGIHMFHPAVELAGRDPNEETREWLGRWNALIESHPSELTRILCADDLERLRPEGRVGILLGMQNSEHFRTVEDVSSFWRLGQRLSQLTYNATNRLGHGCVEPLDSGLSAFGASVVAAMNQCGMIIDVSHAGEQTTLDAFAVSTRPVLITHSNCKALVPHPRCKSDEVIRAMAHKGGVMGITYVRGFLNRSHRASLEDALDHIDHVAKVAGVEHVGIGSDTDLDGYESFNQRSVQLTQGLNHPLRIYDLTEGLLRRGYKPLEIRLILGGNFHRTMRHVFG